MIELVVIWGVTLIAEQTAQYDWRWAAPHLVDIYIFGFVAIPGIIWDSRRGLAIAGLVLGLSNIAICGIAFSPPKLLPTPSGFTALFAAG
jgi:hypothetical protein